MDQIARDFKDRDVVFYVLYTREPHAGQTLMGMDFSEKKQTRTSQERVDNALEMIKKHSEQRPILIDTFGEKCLQNTIGGGRPNSLIVVDKDGKLALWQQWSDAAELRKKLEEMTSSGPQAKAETAGEKKPNRDPSRN